MTRGGRLFSQNSLKLFFLSANKPRKPCLSKETKLFYCSVLGTDTPQFKLSLSHSLNSESSEHRISPAGAVEGVWGRGGREGRGGVSLCGPGQSGCLPPCLSVWLLCRPHTVVPRRLRPAPLLDPPPPGTLEQCQSAAPILAGRWLLPVNRVLLGSERRCLLRLSAVPGTDSVTGEDRSPGFAESNVILM